MTKRVRGLAAAIVFGVLMPNIVSVGARAATPDAAVPDLVLQAAPADAGALVNLLGSTTITCTIRLKYTPSGATIKSGPVKEVVPYARFDAATGCDGAVQLATVGEGVDDTLGNRQYGNYCTGTAACDSSGIVDPSLPTDTFTINYDGQLTAPFGWYWKTYPQGCYSSGSSLTCNLEHTWLGPAGAA